MKRTVRAGGRRIEYTLIQSVRKNVLLQALPEGQTRVYAPKAMRLRDVERREYARTLAELVVNGPEGDWEGDAFDEEMLVMAHFPPALVQAFLQGLRRAGVRPGALKAVLTPTNAQWDSLALYTELCREREAISQGAASAHGQAEEKA